MAESKYLTYKGKPLVRKGNEIYYGKMSDKYVIMLRIVSSKKIGDMDVAEKVLVQLMLTDDKVPATERIVKKSEKIGLYNAMDIAAVWLEKALREK